MLRRPPVTLDRVQSVAAPVSREPSRYGLGSALWALLAGSLLAFAMLVILAIGLSASPLQIFETRYPQVPGRGWPWRIDGVWAAVADIGPWLLVGTLVAYGVGLYVGWRTGRPRARWPIGLCAILVGWIPLAQGADAGILGVGGGLAFFAMWWTTHKVATVPRPRLPGSPRLRIALGVTLAAALTGVSVSYAALHPIRASTSDSPSHVTLRAGLSERLAVFVHNDGPLPARVLRISLADAPDLRIARVERDGPATHGPTSDSLYSPAGHPQITAGRQRILWLTIRGPRSCSLVRPTVTALDVLLTVAGVHRIQHVPLARPVHVGCR
jgi:hypothetical protein